MFLLKCEQSFWTGWWRFQRNINLFRTPFILLFHMLTDSCLRLLLAGGSYNLLVFLACLLPRTNFYFYCFCFISAQTCVGLLLKMMIQACSLLCRKYEEICPPNAEDFCYVTDNTFTKEEVSMPFSFVIIYCFDVCFPFTPFMDMECKVSPC